MEQEDLAVNLRASQKDDLALCHTLHGYVTEKVPIKSRHTQLGTSIAYQNLKTIQKEICEKSHCCCLVAKHVQLFCDPIDCSPPSSSVHEISPARILESVAISSSKGSSRPRDRTQVSCVSCIVRQILYH